jgi:hypothetical protein
MRFANKLSLGAALIGSVILSFSGVAQANDWDHDRYDRDHRVDHRYDHRDDHRRFVEERPVVVHERGPVIVERPVMVAPPVVYSQPSAPSGLNLNFNIPLN